MRGIAMGVLVAWALSAAAMAQCTEALNAYNTVGALQVRAELTRRQAEQTLTTLKQLSERVNLGETVIASAEAGLKQAEAALAEANRKLAEAEKALADCRKREEEARAAKVEAAPPTGLRIASPYAREGPRTVGGPLELSIGAVPGYDYELQGSADGRAWQIQAAAIRSAAIQTLKWSITPVIPSGANLPGVRTRGVGATSAAMMFRVAVRATVIPDAAGGGGLRR